MKNNTSSKSISEIIALVIIFVILGLLGYLTYDRFMNNNNNSNTSLYFDCYKEVLAKEIKENYKYKILEIEDYTNSNNDESFDNLKFNINFYNGSLSKTQLGDMTFYKKEDNTTLIGVGKTAVELIDKSQLASKTNLCDNLYINSAEKKQIIEDNNIKDNFDYKFHLISNNYDNLNSLSSKAKLKEAIYFINSKMLGVPTTKVTYIINGRLNGYILVNTSTIGIVLKNNGYSYNFIISNVDLSEDQLIKFLKTIKFEG